MIRLSTIPILACLASCAIAAPGTRRVSVDEMASTYIAPVNQHMFKLVWPGGGVTEFARDYSVDGGIVSGEGWRGRFTKDGAAEIANPKGTAAYRFLKGRLVELKDGTVQRRFPYEQPRVAPQGTRSPLAGRAKEKLRAAAAEYAMERFRHKWDGTGRLAFPFVNPNQNGALFAQIFVFSLLLGVKLRRLWGRIVLGVACAVALSCLVWSMSRGAWLGTVLALAPVIALRFRQLVRGRWLWCGLGAFCVVLLLWIGLNGMGGLTRGFEAGSWSNALRVEIWRAAPQMMCDAPDGWAFSGSGVAYVNWYQPLNVFAVTPTLINDHLTRLVTYGWLGRIAYLLAAFCIFVFAGFAAFRRHRHMGLALWTVFAVPAWFNPMMHIVWLWVLPIVASISVSRGLPWRSWRKMGALAFSALMLALIVTGSILASGKSDGRRTELIRAEGSRVLVHGTQPVTWLVDDGTIGGGMTGRDIRLFYAAERKAPALGYVARLADLPSRGVSRLILSGDAGAEWLKRYSEDVHSRRQLPSTLLFVSPPFPPSAIPKELHKTCRVRLIIGEFAARYESEYKDPPQWVTVMPGMERYLVRWMWMTMNQLP